MSDTSGYDWNDPSSFQRATDAALSLGKTAGVAASEDSVHDQLSRFGKLGRDNAMRRVGAGGLAGIAPATIRARDPMWYWKQNNIPYETDNREELKKLQALCRMIYRSHPVIGSAIDIYSKYPLTGMELVCKDKGLTDFYTTLFMDQLDYPNFLRRYLREYWMVGEGWSFGSFNETLGVWESDELIHPDTVEVQKSPFLNEPRLFMMLPEPIRNLLTLKQPEWEYKALLNAYPEFVKFANQPEAFVPVSGHLLRQIKFDADAFNPRGIPILMRGMRAIRQEEMLNAAQDAIADRLYTPLVLAKLGAKAQDLGTNAPWVPSPGDISDFESALDAALAGDFRVLTYNFALEMSTVFGRETMPNFDADFDRLVERELQVFGLSKTMLSGGGAGETYAADALNRDLVTQLLSTAQDDAKAQYKARAYVVAEAQEHYDYEERGGRKYPIMEEVLETDPETGEQRIVEQPKLLIPELKIKAMNFHDEANYRTLIESLRADGVAISEKTRLVNVPIDLNEEKETFIAEQVEKAVDAQRMRRQTYVALQSEGLPIPEDLRADFEPKARGASTEQAQVDGQQQLAITPTLGVIPVPGSTPLAPNAVEQVAAGNMDADQARDVEHPGGQITKLPQNRIRQRPVESDEMRSRMPKPASREEIEEGARAGRLEEGPLHIGMRRFANLDHTRPLDDQLPDIEAVMRDRRANLRPVEVPSEEADQAAG